MKRRTIAAVAAFLLLSAALFAWSPPGQRLYYRVDHLPLILECSQRQGVSPYLVASVIFTESRFRAEARSEVGAVGLMQLMPTTASEVAQRMGKKLPPETLGAPEVNIDLGTAYLKELQGRFSSDEMVLAAYNAGPTLVDHWISEKSGIVYPETRSFVESVSYHRSKLEQLYPEWSRQKLVAP